MKVRRILVPVDFSAGSHDAVRHARAIARQFGSTLSVLYALPAADVPAWALQFFGRDLPPSDAGDRARALHRLAALIVAERLDPLRTTGLVRAGRPDEVITQYAKEIDADLIVMGTHGEHEGTPVVGDVVRRVLNAAPCAVLTVPASAIGVRQLARPLLELEPVAC